MNRTRLNSQLLLPETSASVRASRCKFVFVNCRWPQVGGIEALVALAWVDRCFPTSHAHQTMPYAKVLPVVLKVKKLLDHCSPERGAALLSRNEKSCCHFRMSKKHSWWDPSWLRKGRVGLQGMTFSFQRQPMESGMGQSGENPKGDSLLTYFPDSANAGGAFKHAGIFS